MEKQRQKRAEKSKEEGKEKQQRIKKLEKSQEKLKYIFPLNNMNKTYQGDGK